MSQEESKRKRSRLSLKKRKSSSAGTTGNSAEGKEGGTNKTPNILDLLNKQKQGQTAECPVCRQRVILSKMNQHLDSGCLATKHSCQATTSTPGKAPEKTEESVDDTDSPEIMYCNVSHDREATDGKREVSRQIKLAKNCEITKLSLSPKKREFDTKTTGTVSPYFKKDNAKHKFESKRSKLKLTKKSLSFNLTESNQSLSVEKQTRTVKRAVSGGVSIGQLSSDASRVRNDTDVPRRHSRCEDMDLTQNVDSFERSDPKPDLFVLKSENCEVKSKVTRKKHSGVKNSLDASDSVDGDRDTAAAGHTSDDLQLVCEKRTSCEQECEQRASMDSHASAAFPDAVERLNTPEIIPRTNPETAVESTASECSMDCQIFDNSSMLVSESITASSTDTSLSTPVLERASTPSTDTSLSTPVLERVSTPSTDTSLSTPVLERASTPSTDTSSAVNDSTSNTPSTSQEDNSMLSSQSTVEETEEPSKYQPYYLANFFLVMNTVLENDEDRNLFNEDDMSFIEKFKTISDEAQKLYVRLYQRKPTWLRVSKLDYPKIAEDLTPVAAELVKNGFLHTEKDLTDLEETLHLLQAPDLKILAKSLKVSCSGMQRSQIVAALLRHGRQQRSIFGGLNTLILKRAKKSLGSCVKLVRDVKAVFTRLLLLFSLTNVTDEEDVYASGGQSLLSMLFLANYGRVMYHNYTVYRPTVLFRSRDDFLKFQVALQYESDIHGLLGNNDFEGALQMYTEACQQYEPMRQDPEIHRFNTSLPMFLRCYTTSWIYTRILGLGVEILQKLRRYGEAVEKLRELLNQDTYCVRARGRWWDRLALNLDQHLKKPSKSLDAIKEALSDSHVKTGHRLALQQRVFKICESPSNVKLKGRLKEFDISKISETPKVIISGHIKQNDVVNERFYVIKKENEEENEEEILTSRVEEYVLHYYKQNHGYNEGLHGEGSTFTTLIGLLAWDIVFAADIPDVFRYSFQSAPLDMRTDDFYDNRKDIIERRLDLIMKSNVDDLHTMVEETWNTHEGKQCTLVNWELFNDLGHVKGLVSCMGGEVLSGIGRRILRDHRHCRGGVPDLVVWNTVNNTFKIVEVKGPNDRLAHKQILWIDYLNSIGATAEVCHVTAVGGKKLRASIE
ncbi:fanconi-associated nuclease 1-like [Glandiceps talaboti]